MSVVNCVLCGNSCTAEDYCYGCCAYVCEDCDDPDPDKRPQGVQHRPEDHQKPAHKRPVSPLN
jgi:hypothetical protein